MSGEALDKGNEDSIKVVARFRPLNDSEERAGSKFIVTFPQSKDDQLVSIGVSMWRRYSGGGVMWWWWSGRGDM